MCSGGSPPSIAAKSTQRIWMNISGETIHCAAAMHAVCRYVNAPPIPEDIVEESAEAVCGAAAARDFPRIEMARSAKGRNDQKYVICNGDEGDPGAFMDRMILESYPFRVIEGMRSPVSLRRKRVFLHTRRVSPCGCAHAYRHRKMRGGGHFQDGQRPAFQWKCGKGRRVRVRRRDGDDCLSGGRRPAAISPAYPAHHGLHDCPTLVNNVETSPWCLDRASWCRRLRQSCTAPAKAPKSSLWRKIQRGVSSKSHGMTIRQIVEDVGAA